MAQMTLSQMNGWNISGDNYTDFVYDAGNNTAEFMNLTSSETRNLSYITTADGVRLWKMNDGSPNWKNEVTVYGDAVYVPLYKSHIQKATRRKMTLNAIDGGLALLYKDPSALLRRVAIIAIEDVCLVKGYSVIVWLMMAIKNIELTKLDVDNILNYIENLCAIDKVYNDMPRNQVSRTMITSMSSDYRSDVLSLWYRKRAGGMKGDMKMLENAISYYYHSPEDIAMKEVYNKFNIEHVHLKISIIQESIDFHPFPQLLTTLQSRLRTPSKTIKDYIWKVESCVNLRKPETMIRSKTLSQHYIWKTIKPALQDERKKILLRLGLIIPTMSFVTA